MVLLRDHRADQGSGALIADFDPFCLWMHVVVDELWQRLPPA